MPRKSLDAAMTRAARSLAAYFETGQVHTDQLRAAAVDVVKIRSHFTRDDGVTDWAGRTAGYRDAIREVYSRAHLTPDQLQQAFLSKLSYHVRQVIDDTVPAEEKAAAGLRPDNPKARQNAKRVTDAAIAAAFAPDTTAADRVVFAERLLAQAAGEDVASLPARARAVIRIALDGITVHTDLLRAAAMPDAG